MVLVYIYGDEWFDILLVMDGRAEQLQVICFADFFAENMTVHLNVVCSLRKM